MKLLEFNEHFRSEEDCESYLRKEREEKGLVCPVCGGTKHRWDKYNKRWLCCGCHHVTTLRSGTVMHGSNLPLMLLVYRHAPSDIHEEDFFCIRDTASAGS